MTIASMLWCQATSYNVKGEPWQLVGSLLDGGIEKTPICNLKTLEKQWWKNPIKFLFGIKSREKIRLNSKKLVQFGIIRELAYLKR